MIRHGHPPYLEASSKGDIRFSALFARIACRDFRTIEDIYQTAKVFEDGVCYTNWRDAKGKKAINQEEVALLYEQLWREYLNENPYLIPILIKATGISDIFGKPGSQCQATVLYKIRAELITEGSQS